MNLKEVRVHHGLIVSGNKVVKDASLETLSIKHLGGTCCVLRWRQLGL